MLSALPSSATPPFAETAPLMPSVLAAFAVTPLAAALAVAVWGGARSGWIVPALPALCALVPWAWEEVITRRLEWKQRLPWLTVLPALLITPLALDSRVLRHAGLHLPLAGDPSREWRGWRTTSEELERIVREAAANARDEPFRAS